MTRLLFRYPYCFPALVGVLFGLGFPVGTTLYLLWENQQNPTWDHLIRLHEQHHDLLIIWSAPLILGLFGHFVGNTHNLLKEKMACLERQTLQLNSILDTSISAIITLDHEGTILSTNQAVAAIFGYTPAEIVKQPITKLIPELSRFQDEHQPLYQRAISNYQEPPHEVLAQRKSGETFPVVLYLNPMNIEGQTLFTGFIDDISDTKALQQQLFQAQKLEAIGQLASGVAHEINTPIQYIGDNLAALADNMREIMAFQQELSSWSETHAEFRPILEQLSERHDLEFILSDSPKAIEQSRDGVHKVAEIVKAMRAFSHIEDTQGKQLIDIHDALLGALTISRNSYKYIAEIETDFANDIGKIECYASELNQVFLNLIINAAHAIEEKNNGIGRINISTRNLGAMVEILIADNGIGISPDIQEKVFNMFFTTKGVGKGTGQGLSLSHTIVVDKHNGQLFFESNPGIGTTFHIQLPKTDIPSEQ
jgi:two-component system, NtrC family, sensor kinase